MALTFRLGRDGELRRRWYGVYTENGRRRVRALETPMKGTPPSSMSVRDTGDQAFEASRKDALDEIRDHASDARRKGRAEHLTERLIESKTGRTVQYTRIDELCSRWRQMGRKVEAGERHLVNCDAHFRRFIEFMEENDSKAKFLYEVTPKSAAAFVAKLQAKLSPATAQYGIRLMSKAMSRFLPVGAVNPFAEYVGGRAHVGSGVIHRKPFTPDELRKVLAVAQADTFMYPLIVTAACSGMRRGDVCRLKWSDVDLAAGMLTVKTSKTEAEVEVPIFGPLRAVLEGRKRDRSGYVFPEAAKALQSKQWILTWRFKKIVAKALGGESAAANDGQDRVSPKDVRDEALEAIREQVPDGKKQDRLVDVWKRYASGKSFRDIVEETGCSKGTLSVDLHDVQDMIGKVFLPSRPSGSILDAVARVTRVARQGGMMSASVRDWHALRTTFVTLAMSAGVPMELVRRVTGHATVEVVLKHYFRPDREQFKAALAGALPDVLTGGKALTDGKAVKARPEDKLAMLAGKIAAGTATNREKKRLLALAVKLTA